MAKYLITSYAQAIDRIKSFGYIWDVGQIAPLVAFQLHQDVTNIKSCFDGYPLRGPGGEQKRLFEFKDKSSN